MRGSSEHHFREYGLRLGLSGSVLDSVLADATARTPQSSSSHARSTWAGTRDANLLSPADSEGSSESGMSVSVRSSLFEDDDEDESGRERNVESKNSVRTGTAHLVEQMEALRHEKKLLEMDYEKIEKLAQRQLAESTRRFRAQLSELKKKNSALVAENGQLKEKMDARRSDFSTLECSAPLYEQLSQVREEDLSTRELVLVRVFQMTATQRERIATLTENLRTANENAHRYEDIASNHEAILNRVKAKYESQILALEKDLADAKSNADVNKDKFLESLKHNDGLHERASMYMREKKRCEELERDRLNALEQTEQAIMQRKLAEDTLATKSQELRSLQEELELIKVDKTYLKHERDDSKQALTRLESQMEREKERYHKLEERRDELREQLIEANRSAKTEYEQRLEKEVQSIKLENAKQLKELKETQLATWEREARSLRTAREEALSELDHTKSQLESAKDDLEQLKLELATVQAKHQTSIAEVRSQVTMRIYENETITNNLEEKCSTIRKLELNNDMLQSKLEILRSDFSSLETGTSKQIVELNAKVAMQEEKLNVYEALELELDSALLERAKYRLAQGVEHKSDGLENEVDVDAVERIISQQQHQGSTSDTLTLLPVAAQRRVKHSILLAQRLVKTERHLEAAKAETTECKAAMDILKKKLREAEQAAIVANQPQAYLVNQLKSKEEVIEQQKVRMNGLEKSLADLEASCTTFESERDELHKDLQAVLRERASLESAVRQQAEELAKVTSDIPGHSRRPRRSPQSRDQPSSPLQVDELVDDLETYSRDDENEQHNFDIHVELEEDDVMQEVDQPDNPLNSSVLSVTSLPTSSFILLKEDDQGIPLPKWYRKLRQPPGHAPSSADP